MRCRLCNNNNLSLYYTQGGSDQFHFYKCHTCQLVNLDLSGLNYLEHQEKYAMEYPDPYDPFVNRGSFASHRFIRKNLPSPGRFLDVGCGNGALLAATREDGWEVKGLELSGYLAENVREQLKIEVEVADFLTYELSDGQFDLVTLRHVLEHLPDSLEAMEKINRLLKIGGSALLEFPNIEGVSFKVKRFLEKNNIRKKSYPKEWQPGHCNEFSRESFAFLAKETGFEVMVWETYAYSPLKNLVYNRIPIGTKARVLVRKVSEAE